MFDWSRNSGLYLLVLEVEEACTVEIGKLGSFPFNPGIYLYIGRARVNLRQRIARHSRREKRLRWHIDYLLPHAQLLAVFPFPFGHFSECMLAGAICERGGICYPPGFGASDCGCPGHLVHLPGATAAEVLHRAATAP